MLVAALSLYARGERMKIPGREFVGRLAIKRDGVATIATLSLQGAMGNQAKHATVLPPLYEPVVKSLANGRIDIRGIEREGQAWHLQLWSCRVVTSIEAEIMHRTPGAVHDGLEAVYLRWWALVWDAATSHGLGRSMEIADIPPLVEAPIEDVWPFIDWADRTQRSVASLGGKDGLGGISLKRLQGLETGEKPES